MYNYPPFKLENFEGPLELLYFLIQKEEIDPCGVVIQQLTSQLIHILNQSVEVEASSEMLHLTASLLLIKSQKLLPHEAKPLEEQAEDPRLEMIQSLIEYCRFKDMAKALSEKEELQKAYFPRPLSPFKKELGTGLDDIDQEGLKRLLQKVLKKATEAQRAQTVIHEEKWHIADKMLLLQAIVQTDGFIHLETLFASFSSREELIVSFLALLELMKHQQLKIVTENGHLYIWCYEAGF